MSGFDGEPWQKKNIPAPRRHPAPKDTVAETTDEHHGMSLASRSGLEVGGDSDMLVGRDASLRPRPPWEA